MHAAPLTAAAACRRTVPRLLSRAAAGVSSAWAPRCAPRLAAASAVAWQPAARGMARQPVRALHASSVRAQAGGMPPAAQLRHMRIWYGSQTGTAAAFAAQLADGASTIAGMDMISAQDLNDIEPADLLKASAETDGVPQPTVFIVSCFGRGEPTDSAKAFVAWLNEPARESERDAFSKLRYTVFGLGSSKTHKEYYNVVGKKLDARLQALGAVRMAPHGEGDDSDCIEVDFETWEKELRASMTTVMTASGDGSSASAAAASAASPILSVTKVNPYHSDGNAFNITFPGSNCDIGTKCAPVGSTAEEGYTPLEVHGLQNLTPGEYRPIFELSLGNCEQLPYETGDHIAILPENLMECVYRLCDRLCWDPDTTIALESATGMANSKLPFTGATTIGDMLRTRFDLNAAVTPHMIRTLASFSTKAEHAEALNKLTERTEYISGVRDQLLSLYDLLCMFPSANLPLDKFITLAPRIVPRYYSISSSPLVEKDLKVTFRHVRLPRAHGRSAFQGLCSTYMANRQPGNEIMSAVRTSSFRLPANPARPVIFVGGGIGIAPFAAFMKERNAQAAGGKGTQHFGPSTLFYGCRDRADAVYLDMMRDSVITGGLSSYDVGYAAPSKSTLAITPRPRLAHELMLEHSQEVWDILSRDGVVYVCGGAAGFGQAIVQGVKDVCMKHGGMSVEQADAYMSDMLKEDRYLEDLAD